MVGSIGEVLVAENCGLQLLPASHETHHAVVPDGRYVQIKATQIRACLKKGGDCAKATK